MKELHWLIKNMLTVLLKNKKGFLIMVGLPIVGIFISMLIYGGSGVTTLRIGVVSHDNDSLTADTITFIKGLDHVKLEKVKESDLNNKIASGTLDAAVMFDKGFGESLRNGHPQKLRMVSIKGASVTGYIKAYLNNYLDNIMTFSHVSKGNSQVFNKLYQQYQQKALKVTTGTLKDTESSKLMTYQTIGYLIMFMMFSAFNLSGIITKEKENRTYFRLLSTPIDAKKFVLANVITNLMIMVVQIIVTLVFLTRVFHITAGIPIWELFASLFLFALVSVGLSLASVAFATNGPAASALQNLIVSPTCLLAGCFFPIDIMPKTLQNIADFLPQHWLLDTIQKLQEGLGLGHLYLNIMILIAFSATFFLLAVYKFSRNDQVRNYI